MNVGAGLAASSAWNRRKASGHVDRSALSESALQVLVRRPSADFHAEFLAEELRSFFHRRAFWYLSRRRPLRRRTGTGRRTTSTNSFTLDNFDPPDSAIRDGLVGKGRQTQGRRGQEVKEYFSLIGGGIDEELI